MLSDAGWVVGVVAVCRGFHPDHNGVTSQDGSDNILNTHQLKWSWKPPRPCEELKNLYRLRSPSCVDMRKSP